jgi:hypothetical protein
VGALLSNCRHSAFATASSHLLQLLCDFTLLYNMLQATSGLSQLLMSSKTKVTLHQGVLHEAGCAQPCVLNRHAASSSMPAAATPTCKGGGVAVSRGSGPWGCWV